MQFDFLHLLMQFRLSVFYIKYYISYNVTTEDKTIFHFTLKSKPKGEVYAPDSFTVTRLADGWKVEPELLKDFQESLIKTLKGQEV